MSKRDDLTKRIHEAGGRMTRQRRIVLETLASVDTHPTAAELYEMVRARIPDISQGTVYRNLRQLQELGYVAELDYGPGASHFDARVEPHYHVRCRSCGRVADLPCAPIDCLEQARRSADGWIIDEQRVEFTGLCPDCQANRTDER